MRKVLTIEVSQAGIQLDSAICEQYYTVHGIDNGGKYKEKITLKVFFGKTGIGTKFRSDLEFSVIDDAKNEHFVTIFHSELLVHGKEDTANNFVRGYYIIGKQIIDCLRKVVDNCNNIMCFVIGHSVCKGTGSVLGALILESLSVNYRMMPKLRIAKTDINNLNELILKVIYTITVSLQFSSEFHFVGLSWQHQAKRLTQQSKVALIVMNEVPAVTLKSDDIGAFNKNALMVTNNIGIPEYLANV
ncbi:hypothetical protein RFI_32004 [Reticulomyxa filosa]|uniref:Tubulin/FtsZ GTPase domain-containing protein n=1 Tax=Reticulomyxa filosa TaxID=46433 RepID=X6LW87_RETFI|nr:hypothetical protein RFI_32004 [Reticulomyxa filosa]|eukprot:ETO05392.1 hypothetical protein RFI_32004 [Reticulomyxa filosa]